jgi:Rieske Fe-S protein
MSDDDVYPGESGRRRFVKGVVGGAVLAGGGAAGAGSINLATSATGAGGGSTQAYAIENTGGPAPRGMPIIPIDIADDGTISGAWPEVITENQGGREVTLARTEDFRGSGVTYSQEWFQYCGVEAYAGLVPDADQENTFRVGSSPAYEWQSEAYSEGDALNVADFDDYDTWTNEFGDEAVGKPATAVWRSVDVEDTIPVQVIRSERIEALAEADPVVDAFTQDGFVAWLNKCTHFCCVPGWKQSADAAKFGETDEVYCQCHQSLYDPFSVVQTLFVARPRPTG